MNARLQSMLQQMNPNAGHVVIVARGDGRTMILGTSNARARLPMIVGASPLEHQVEYVETEHFRAIEADLLTRFRHVDDGYGHWIDSDLQRIQAAIAEYDLETGARVRCDGLTIGDRVYVKGLGKGDVTGFTSRPSASPLKPCERVIVHLECHGFFSAARQLVKPVLRIAT